MKTAKGIYHRCVEFEERAASIYLQLASRFSSDRRLGAYWLEMAMEEKQHAGLLQFCVEEGLFVPDLPNESTLEQIGRLFADLQKRVASPKLTVDEAFSIAIDMESSEVNGVFGRLTTSLHKSSYLAKRKIATFVPHHLENLIAAARRFGIRPTDRLPKKAV